MALCLAASLVARRDYVPYDQLVRYKWWYRNGYMSSTGRCFDIGAATSQSLREFERRQIGFANKHGIPPEQMDFLSRPDLLKEFDVFCSVEGVAGNGALMRLAPVPLFFHQHPIEAVEFSGLSGSITHGDRKAFDACRYYGALIVAALRGEEKEQLLGKDFYSKHRQWFNGDPLHPDIMKIAEGSYQRGGYDKGIRGRGYIVSALEAALWAFWSDKGSFEKGVLAAVNLGDDTDTTAAIYGQLAGAHYGYKILPEKWLGDVYAKSFILCLSKWIAYEGQRWQPDGSSPQRPRCNTDPDAASAFGSGSNEQFPANHSKSAPSEMPTSSPQTAYHDENLKSCDDVCRWIQKLGEIGAKYLDVFHNHYVDGYWLLNHVDDKLLKKYGIDSADHRRVIINGIEQLKKNAQCNPTPAEKSKP